jgi:hypothetical protein
MSLLKALTPADLAKLSDTVSQIRRNLFQVMNVCEITGRSGDDDDLTLQGTMELAAREINRLCSDLGDVESALAVAGEEVQS